MNGTDIKNGDGAEHAGPLDSPIPCPRTQLPLLDPDGHRAAGRPADPVDSQERATLMRAFTHANAGLAKAQTALGELCTELERTFQAARTAIDAAERLTVGRSAGEACRQQHAVRARHALDGPEHLARSRQPWVWLQWVMVAASALFDLPFVGEAVSRLLDVGPGSVWQTTVYVFGYLAALGVSCLQLALGAVLGRSLYRWKVRSSRRTERVRRGVVATCRHWWGLRDGTRTETRRHDDLPWAGLTLPLLANGLLVGALAATADSRARQSHQVTATFGQHGYIMAVFLIIVLNLATLTITTLAHNPHAESAKAAKSAVSDAEKSARGLFSEARLRLVTHSTSWHRLHAAVQQATADAYRVVDEACARIIEERADSGVAGALQLPLRDYAWPADENRGDPATPRLRLDTLAHYESVLRERYAPELLENWLEDTAAELNVQFEQPDIARPTSGSTAPAAQPEAGRRERAEPAEQRSDAGHTETVEPEAGHTETVEPDAGRTDAAEPDAGRTDAAEPDAGRTDAAEPDAGRTDAAEPEAGEPDVGEPGAGGGHPEQPGAGRADPKGPDAGIPEASG
ncbi:hypothetical protein [Streptomyces sediminimaris]|uniref:hypothetical protein n=1 Tax=Streptomyces sediminimaris TaxID=3383721 RepID=UPI00399B717E